MRKNRIVLLILLVAITILPLSHNTLANSTPNLKVHFIDVGQADSILIELPNKQTMLIDAGNNEDRYLVVNYLNKLNIDKINYLIGTHPHEDHIGGLDTVINSFKIDNLYLPQVTHTSQTFKEVLLDANRKNLKITPARAGLKLLATNNLEINMLAPIKNNYTELNNWSTVVKVKYKNNSFLFTGDAETEAEYDIISSGTNLKADVLKIGHHGSYSSTTDLFLRRVNPDYAIISVGQNNRYHHPAYQVISKLNQAGVKIYRTDQQGTIIATSTGEEIKFNTTASNVNHKVSSTSNIIISDLNLKTEIVTLKNTSNQDINLAGWKLVSSRGKQTFYFSSNQKIKAGSTLKIASGRKATKSYNTIIWTKKYIWNNNGDQAKLYNQQGELVSKY